MSLNLFGWLNQVLVTKKNWDEFSDTDRKTFQPYMINRFLSMDDEFLEAVNYFQKYSVGLLESREVYKWYCDVLPKGKRYNKYIKNRNSKKYDKLLVSTVSKHFECSSKQAIEYIELINKEGLKQILEMYGIEPKKIKLLKLEK